MEQGNLLSKTAQMHTQWKNNLLLKKIVTLRHSTRTTSSTVQSTRRTLTSTFQDCHIQQWNGHMASTFEIRFRRSRTISKRSSTTSTIQSFEQRITRNDSWRWEHWTVWTTRCWTQSTVQSMSVVLGRRHRLLHVRSFLTRWNGGEQEVHQVSSWPLFNSELFTSGKVDHTVTDTERKKVSYQEYHTANQLQKKCKKREFLSIHDRFIRDARFRKTMIELGRTEEVIREMDKLANEDHTHNATEEELNVYRSNWWIRSNFVGSDTMPIRHRADFKEALSTLRRLKNEEDQAYYQKWQSSSSSWWNWQDSWWHPSSETSPRRWTQHWLIGETWWTVIGLIIRGMSLKIYLVQKLQWLIR